MLMKKDVFNLRLRSRWLLVSLLALLAGGASPAWAENLTVHDGTESSYIVPIFGYRSDSYVKMEYILPATELSDMAGGTISGLTYYLKSSESSSYGNANFVVFLKEVSGTTISAFSGYTNNDIVYQGSLDATGETLSIPFSKNYTYGGGNLLIGIYNTTKGTAGGWQVAYYYGTTATSGASAYSYSSQSMAQATYVYKQSFLPKTTFAYTASSCKPPKNLTITNITYESADLSWSKGDEADTNWQIVYSTDANFDKDAATPINVSSTSYSFTDLDPGTNYYVAVRTYGSESEQSAWVSTSFKTAKVAVPATGFIDDFESNKGWDLINGTVPNKWVRGTGTNNGGSYSMYISYDGTSYPTSSYGSSSLVYATKLFSFEAGDYTIAYDWKCNGEGNYDFLRVGLVPADVELTASTSYSSLGSGSTLPTGWTMWLDGGSKLGGSTTWATKSVDFTIETAGNYQVVFAWRNDGSTGSSPAAIDNFKILGAAPVLEVGGDVIGTTLAFGSVSETTVKTITITNSGKVAMENITLTETADADNAFAAAALSKTSLDPNESMDVEVTFSGTTAKDYTATYRVAADDVDAIDIEVTATYSNAPAQMAVKYGEDAVGETVAFGSVGKAISKTFTVVNDGDQTLNVTIASNNTTDFTVSPAALEVVGHSSETFTVTFVYPNESPVLDVEKTANITVTPSNEGLTAKTFAVKGTRIEQWSEDFSGNALPNGWERTSTTYWTFADGVAKGSYPGSTAYYLITPSLAVDGTNASLSFDYVATGNYTSITIEKSKNGGTWESCTTTPTIGSLNTGNSGTATITGLEAGNYKFRFKADSYNLDNFQGFKLNANDPKLGAYTDAGCNVAAATSVTKDFGFVTEDATQIYYIKNDGTGTLTLDQDEVPAGFSAVLGKTELAKDESTTLTITFGQISSGYRSGNIIVNGSDGSSFTVAVSGVMVDNNKLNLDFATASIPSTWTNTNFTKNSTDISCGYNTATLQTASLTAEANEQVVVRAYQEYTSTSYTFGVNYRQVGEESWHTLIAAANIGKDYVTLVGTITEAGNYELQFTGKYVHISNIYGLTEALEPVMAVYDGESLAGASYGFGNKSDEADATWTLTVKNEGKATLTGLAAALSGDNADHYSVEVSATELAVNATATVTVKQLKNNLGNHNATLTISADDPIADKVIELSGFTYDHNKLFVDFENNALPTAWTANSWTVATTSGNYHARAGYTASSLITTPLTVGADESLVFKAKRQYSNSAPTFQIRYTSNGGVTWTDYADYASQVTTGDFTNITLSGIPAGTAIVEIYGRYVDIDDIYGFAPTTAPVMALTESNDAVVNGSTKEFGTLTAAATATYVLSNTGNGDLVSTLDSDVVTFEVTAMGQGVTKSENTLTIPAGKSATIVVTMPYVAPYEAKNGSLTITSTGWVAPVTLNYTATLNDPAALYEDFAGNAKPAGWYQEASGWLFTQGTAHVYTGVDKEIITEKYGAEAGKNVLSFDAKLQSTYADGELKVYTSTDRQDWTLAKTVTLTEEGENVSLNALADGEYYVKFVSLNASIDNLAGLKKLTAPEHDLYVSATTFPTATLIPETVNGVSASATVNSLRATEEGVYAKLFFDDAEVATADAHSVSLDGSYTFSMTCNVPATEKTYAAKIVVYYGDNTVAWESQTTNVVVSQTRTLQITDFALTSEATVNADVSNQFTSTFNVTVKNNGTIAQDAANVSVSITDADGNVLNGNATSWTAANSQTIFVTPGDYATADAVLALYSWGKAESWSRLTETNIAGFYSGELNGNTNFRIVRLKPSTAEDYNAENNGLNDANIWNRSTDMATSDGNVFTFKGWDDKNDDGYHWFTYGTMGQLAVGVSTTMSVSVTTSALEGGTFTFKAKENLSNTVSTASATVTVNAAAPKFELALGSEAIEDGDAVAYGIVKEATTKTFTITNAGSAPLLINSINVPEGFTYSDGEDSDWKIYLNNNNDIDGDAGTFKKTATEGVFVLNNLVITGDAGFEIHTSDWSEKYAELTEDAPDITELGTRTLESGQKYKWLKLPAGTYGAVWNYNTKELTFREAGIPAGETADVKVTLKAEQGKVSGNLTFTYKVDAATNSTFTVALSGRSIDVDTWSEDFEGTDPLATWFNENGWTVYNSDGNNVARLTGWDAKAVITPRLEAAENEILTFDVLSLGNALSYAYSTDGKTWSDEVVITTTGEQTFTASEAGNYYLRFTGRNAYIDNLVGFKLDPLTIELSETDGTNVEAGYYATVTLNRTFAAGWNTVCLPFAVTKEVFGTGAKVYDFTGYDDSALKFTEVTTKLVAAKPYVVYVANAITNPIVLNNITISETEASSTTWNYATFQGTYTPMAAGTMTGKYGVTNEAKIAKGSDKASMKGFRAYFVLPQGAAARIAFFDENGNSTKIGTIAAEKAEGQIFNLQGQRVENLKKDNLYIINGKKVVIK